MGTSTVTIVDRNTISVTGIISVVSTSCSEFVISTDTGLLKINGSRLTISALDLCAGTISLTGVIWGVNYTGF